MLSSCFGMTLRELCVFFLLTASFRRCSVFHLQLLWRHILPEFHPPKSFESHRSEKSHINIKANGFKPRRDTYLQDAFSQSLWNHILPKKGHGGGGSASLVNRRSGCFVSSSVSTSVQLPISDFRLPISVMRQSPITSPGGSFILLYFLCFLTHLRPTS